jgi:hypothetical protein
METKEHESNWAQACRALGFDRRRIMQRDADASAREATGHADERGSATSRNPGSYCDLPVEADLGMET